jgi:phytoene desaturase
MAELKAAVIGSGFGGLAAAIRLQARGIATTIFEARALPGGRAYAFAEKGHVFDMGPTLVTAPQCLEELFALGGARLADRVELLPLDPFYRLQWEDGTHFEAFEDEDRLAAEIERIAPGEAAGYARFKRYSEAVYREGYEHLAGAPFVTVASMLRSLPKLVGLRAERSVYGAVSRRVRAPHLRQALSFHPLFVGGDPFSTSAIYALINHLERTHGVWFVRGGTHALVRALVGLFEELGGELRLETPVASARLEGRQHCLTHAGGEDRFDLVVSNADVMHTYQRIYGAHAQGRRMARRLARSRWSMGLFVVYFGTDCQYRDQVRHHTILFGARYRELIREIFNGPELPPDFSLYLHAPTVTDPTLAPAGGDTFYALSPVPHLGNADLDWDRIGERYAERILAYLDEHAMPGLRQHLTVRRWMTPRDFERELGAFHGNGFSLAPVLWQSAYLRPHNRDRRIPGLYLVGAGTHPGAGVPGVVNSAKATMTLVDEDFPR